MTTDIDTIYIKKIVNSLRDLVKTILVQYIRSNDDNDIYYNECVLEHDVENFLDKMIESGGEITEQDIRNFVNDKIGYIPCFSNED